MNNSFSTLFYIRVSNADKSGRCLIYLRITIEGKRAEMSTKRKVKPTQWNALIGKLKGNSSLSTSLNRYLNELDIKAFRAYERFKEQGLVVTPGSIRDSLDGRKKREKSIFSIYENHNKEIFDLVKREEYSQGAYLRHCRTAKYLKSFLINEYKVEDIPVKNIDLHFINRYEHYLKVTLEAASNTITKYIVNFKKIVRIAYANDWIAKDPFLNWKAKWIPVERQALTELELQNLINKTFHIKRLDQVKDIFVFCCFTGLSYADVKKLKPYDISADINGQKWIKIKRKKTNLRVHVPLLTNAKKILIKYQKYQDTNSKNLLLPVISNEKLNAYLKEIAAICGIRKRLTFHLSRHTFATTVTLANGVPIESVSKMLGHSSLKTTQIYAKVLDNKIINDMKEIIDKY